MHTHVTGRRRLAVTLAAAAALVLGGSLAPASAEEGPAGASLAVVPLGDLAADRVVRVRYSPRITFTEVPEYQVRLQDVEPDGATLRAVALGTAQAPAPGRSTDIHLPLLGAPEVAPTDTLTHHLDPR